MEGSWSPRCPKCSGATKKATGKTGDGYLCLRFPDCRGFLRETTVLSGEQHVLVASQEYLGACVIAAGIACRENTDDWTHEEIADIAASLAKRISERIEKK